MYLWRGVLAPHQPVPSSDENINWNTKDIVTHDVCIIGGGASGTYAAMRLRDMNQSVVIVEQKDRLGGHTDTYTGPATKAKIDLGVIVWHNLDIVRISSLASIFPLRTRLSSQTRYQT
jgi:monoamine oxidase